MSSPKTGVQSMWNSSAELARILQIIRWAPAIAGLVTVIAAVSVAVVSNRLDALRAQEATPRRLSAQQQRQIAEIVDKAKSSCDFFVSCPIGDSETQTYAADFVQAFHDGGGSNAQLSYNSALRPDLAGLFVVHDDSANGLQLAAMLNECLSRLQIEHGDFFATDNNLIFGKGVGFLVGRKPN